MKRSEEGAGHRHARLEELIREELRGLFRDDVSDPALARVRITRLVLSVDYRHARVRYVLEGGAEADVRHVAARLVRATPFLRARIGEAIDVKRVPDLTFVLDAATPPTEAP
jgi:ribosome-binding factor A